jgi:hypothetical protein
MAAAARGVEAPFGDGELGEGGAGPGGGEVPGPAEAGLDGALAVGEVATGASEREGAACELLAEDVEGECAGACGGELEGEGAALEQSDEGDDGGGRVVAAAAAEEQGSAVVVGEGPEEDEVLGAELEGDAAGADDGEPGRCAEPGGDLGGDVGDDLLCVVEDEEEPPTGVEGAGESGGGVAACELEFEGAGDGEADAVDGAGLGEVGEPGAADEAWGELAGELGGEAGLAGAAWPEEGDEPGAGAESVLEVLQLCGAPHERVGGGPEVVAGLEDGLVGPGGHGGRELGSSRDHDILQRGAWRGLGREHPELDGGGAGAAEAEGRVGAEAADGDGSEAGDARVEGGPQEVLEGVGGGGEGGGRQVEGPRAEGGHHEDHAEAEQVGAGLGEAGDLLGGRVARGAGAVA